MGAPLTAGRPLLDHVAKCAIARAPFCGHPSENRHSLIDIVYDQDIPFSVMFAMQPTDILRQSSFPGDRHRQEQRVETGVVKTFADVAACREDQTLVII